MTFHLYIMRHAKSDRDTVGQPDFERPLNKRGLKNAAHIGQWMLANNRLPQKIISSSAVRAKQTTELLVEQFAGKSPVNIIYEQSLYLADPDTLIEFINLYKDNGNSLMLVAHNPGLEQLIHILSNDLNDEYVSMTTANLAILEYDDNKFEPGVDKGRLIEFIKPKEIS